MHLTISGTGPAVVLIHGFCESSFIWKKFARTLSKHYQIVCLDLPGHGQSPPTGQEFSLEDVARHVHLHLQAHQIDSYFVVGHSMGGYMALALADLYPDHLLGFGLFHSSAYADDESKKATRDKVAQYISKFGIEDFAKTFVPGLFAPHSKLRYALAIEEMVLEACKTSASEAITYSMAIKNRPERLSLLANYPKPVFVIGGDEDPSMTLADTQKMAALINIGEALILKNTGHHGFLEAERESLDFFKAFFDRYLLS